MTTFTQSSVITGYDASALYRPSAGQGGPARMVETTAVILAGTTDATSVIYRMVRVPTFAIIKSVEVALTLNGGTATTFTGNIGLYWSDNSVDDGTSPIVAGSTTPVSTSFFAYELALAAVGTLTDETFANRTGNSATDGFYVPDASFQPLWVALTSGGYQGCNSQGIPNGPWNSNPSGTTYFAGQGATSSSSATGYQLYSDPGGFWDICFNPTSTNSLSKAMNFTMRVRYAIGG